MNDQKYILDGHTPVPATLLEWAKWFETHDRHVANDVINGKRISTVFMGLDHNFGDDGKLEIFETMVFQVGSWDEELCWRCATWDEAEAQHKKACELVRAGEVVHQEV